ncbi:MAG: TrbI/VirB10 family protein [Pseudomonadota bacterium]
MSEAAPMSPDESPNMASKKSGVRRVNNLPVYIIGGLMGVFLLIMALVAADRAERQSRPQSGRDAKTTSTSMFANELAGQARDGIIPAAKAAPLVAPDMPSSLAPITIVRPDNLEMPPLPPGTSMPVANQREIDQRTRIEQEKIHQLEEAIKARTGVQISAPRSAGSPPSGVTKLGMSLSREEAIARIAAVQQQIEAQTHDDPTAAYQARLRQLQEAGITTNSAPNAAGQAGAPTTPPAAPSISSGKDYGQFGGAGQQDRWQLDSQVQAPRSPYELRAGFVVPATLISGINSDLPGQVIGQVSQDVFDTATGKWKLIPQGSRLVGQYSSDVAYGQARILIAWQRIVFPDGKALDIGAMPGADSAGYGGFKDQVNNHYLRIFGSALLMSGVTAGIAQSQSDSYSINSTRPSARSALSEALGQQLGMVAAQMIAKNMSIAPTLEIRPGYRFNVVVTKDMTFSKPYQAFDY